MSGQTLTPILSERSSEKRRLAEAGIIGYGRGYLPRSEPEKSREVQVCLSVPFVLDACDAMSSSLGRKVLAVDQHVVSGSR